jgi:hypothetical protein
MVDPVSALTAGVIVDLAARKFLESSAGKLAEKFTESAIQKMGDLWSRIKTWLNRRPQFFRLFRYPTPNILENDGVVA